MNKREILWMIIVLLLIIVGEAHGQDVVTKSYNNSRSGAYTQEKLLTPTSVKQYGMRLNPLIPVIGDARGMESQPLIFNKIMLLPSMGNVVRATDLLGNAIWQTKQLCVPVNSVSDNDMWRVNQHFGVTSTGVVDTKTGKLWIIGTCSKDGSGSQQSMTQRVYSIDIATGTVLTNNLVDGTSNGFTYSDAPRKQRSALAMYDDGTYRFVIFAAGSFSEYGPNATGWVGAVDTYDGRVKAMLSTHAGIWESGQGVKIDKNNFIYIGAGNGPYNGVTQFGEAMLKIKFTPPSVHKTSVLNNNGTISTTYNTWQPTLTVINSWIPFLDTARVCTAPKTTAAISNKIAGESAPSSTVPGASMPMTVDCGGQWADQDAFLTSTILEDFDLLIGAGKDGIGYIFDLNNFPQTTLSNGLLDTKNNCSKLVGIYQFGWNLGIDPCPINSAQLNVFPGNLTRHQHSGILVFKSNDGNTYLLFFAENSPLQAWRVNKDKTFTFIARSVEVASDTATGMHGGMPGAFGTVTSNNGANGMAWYSIPHGDANRTLTTGYLAAFDLSNLGSLQGTGKPIPLIWRSNDYVYNKFMSPIDNGSNGIVLPNYDGSVMLFTLNK